MTGKLLFGRCLSDGMLCWRAKLGAAFLFILALALISVPPANAAGLTITATFDPSLTAPEIAVINSAIAFYQDTFSDPINVAIEFTDISSGLGQSTTALYSVSYMTFITALRANATSADDDLAIGGGRLPIAALNPVTGTNVIYAKGPNLRALGISDGPGLPGGYDGIIGLNTSITDVDGGSYSLLAVAEHEIDEVLGLGSDLPSFTTPAPEDLFRYASGANVRSFSTNSSTSVPCSAATPHVFFSIDGTAHASEFNNCNNGGDYGDWITHSPANVQDAYATPGSHPVLTATSTETRALDVIGYHIAVKKRRGQLIGY